LRGCRKGIAALYGQALWRRADGEEMADDDAADQSPTHQEGDTVTALARKGGIAASIILILLGVGAMVAGVAGREKVRSDLAREQIVGTPDSTIPGQKVDTGGEAQAFAVIMRKHTLEATGGQTYAQMGRFLDESGKPTSDESAAATDPKSGQPVENPARNIWISSTAFQTALNTAYFAESVATFAIAFGAAMLLVGIGFLVLTIRLLDRPDPAGVQTAKVGAAAPAAG
jgi:hypothetical protein